MLKFFGERVGFLGAQLTYGSILMVVILVGICLVRAQPDRLGPPRLRRRRRHARRPQLAGIRTDRILISVYALAGVVCALGAWAAIGRVGSVSPQAFYEGNLDCDHRRRDRRHSACSAAAARSSAPLIGALIVGVFRSGLRLVRRRRAVAGQFAVGWLIIIAVADRPVDQKGVGMNDTNSQSRS